MLHIEQNHKNGPKAPSPPPVKNEIAEEAVTLSQYLLMSKVTRETFGIERKENGGEIFLSDHEKFLRMDNHTKEKVKKAIELANRRIKK